jgi:hypothetical protein
MDKISNKNVVRQMVKGKHTEKLQVGRQEVVDARNCFALR